MEDVTDQSERLKKLSPYEAVLYTYDQITLNPDDEKALLDQLSKHFIDTKPSEAQLREARRKGIFKAADMINSHQDTYDGLERALEEPVLNRATLLEYRDKLHQISENYKRFTAANNTLDAYATKVFGKSANDL